MKVIDPRNGIEMKVGQTSEYPGGESITLLDVKPGWFAALARVRSVTERGTSEFWTPLQVRWTHPRFFLQHVGFLPS